MIPVQTPVEIKYSTISSSAFSYYSTVKKKDKKALKAERIIRLASKIKKQIINSSKPDKIEAARRNLLRLYRQAELIIKERKIH